MARLLIYLIFISLSVLIDNIEVIIRKKSQEYTKRQLRLNALRGVRLFLSPYKSIWHNLKLSNKFCTLKLGYDGITITCTEKVAPYRQLKITGSSVHSHDQLWNMFCKHFSYNTSYNGILEDCQVFKLRYTETISMAPQNIPNKNILDKQMDSTNRAELWNN